MIKFSTLIRKFHIALTLEYSPFYIRFWPIGLTPMQSIRRTVSRSQLQQYRYFWRFGLHLALLCIWPFRFLRSGLRLIRRFGPLVKKRHGKGYTRQIIELIGFAFGRGVPPLAYYRYALYQKHRGRNAGDFLQDRESLWLGWHLNKPTKDDAINDKRRFSEICLEHGIPTPPIWALVDTNGISYLNEAKKLPYEDLFLKPVRGSRGVGAVSLRCVGSGGYRSSDGRSLSPDDIIDYLVDLGREQDYLVQPLLSSHSYLSGMTNGALAAARILTGRMPDGEIHIIAATFKIPVGNAITSTNGLNCAIDLETGNLGQGFPYRPMAPGRDIHPNTGKPIAGQTLPDWREALNLTRKVHAKFPEYVFLGWDVAFTEMGPLVLEGNLQWDVSTVQTPEQKPLGNTPFVDVCAGHMDIGRTYLSQKLS